MPKSSMNNEIHAFWFQSTTKTSREMSINATRRTPGSCASEKIICPLVCVTHPTSIRAINWHIKSEESRERINAIDTFVGLLSYYVLHDGLRMHRICCRDCKARGEANCRSAVDSYEERSRRAASLWEQRDMGYF